MIEFNIHCRKGDFLLNVSNAIPTDGVTALFGPSGCGKTTLLRAISGLDRTQNSFVSFNGQVWQNENEFIPVYKRKVGFVFQEASLFPHMTVKANLEYGLKRVIPNSVFTFEKIISLFELNKHLPKNPDQLSGGERQRTAIARALLAGPELLILDEPLTGLDNKSKSEILSFLDKMISELNIPVLYVSHDTGEVARLADHVMILNNGEISASGGVQELFSNINMEVAQSINAETLIETIVESHDNEFFLTTLKFDGGHFQVSKINREKGEKIRLRILAKGVSLTLNNPENTSIQNILKVTVKDMKDVDRSSVNVLLDASGTPILSRITKKSAHSLNIQPGLEVYAQVKSVELLL